MKVERSKNRLYKVKLDMIKTKCLLTKTNEADAMCARSLDTFTQISQIIM
jgi:hypothetical protein